MLELKRSLEDNSRWSGQSDAHDESVSRTRSEQQAETITIPSQARLERVGGRIWVESWTSSRKGAIMESKNDNTTKIHQMNTGERRNEEPSISQSKETKEALVQVLLREMSELREALHSRSKEVERDLPRMQRDELERRNMELERANSELNNKLAALDESFQKVADDILSIDALRKQRDAAELRARELEQTIWEIRAGGGGSDELKKEIRELKRINSTLLDEIEALKQEKWEGEEQAELPDQHGELAQENEALESRLRQLAKQNEELLSEVRRQRDDLASRNEILERKVKELHGQIEQVQKYPKESTELLTKDRKQSRGLDIVSVSTGDVTSRTSSEEEVERMLLDAGKPGGASFYAAPGQPGKERTVVPLSKESHGTPRVTRSAEPKIITPNAVKVKVIAAGEKIPSNNVAHDKPFAVAIGINKKALGLEQGATARCIAELHALPIEGGSSRHLGQHNGVISEEGTFTVSAPARMLPQGFYYLQTYLTVSYQDSSRPPRKVVGENIPINVY
jgi:hypothetical protein